MVVYNQFEENQEDGGVFSSLVSDFFLLLILVVFFLSFLPIRPRGRGVHFHRASHILSLPLTTRSLEIEFAAIFSKYTQLKTYTTE